MDGNNDYRDRSTPRSPLKVQVAKNAAAASAVAKPPAPAATLPAPANGAAQLTPSASSLDSVQDAQDVFRSASEGTSPRHGAAEAASLNAVSNGTSHPALSEDGMVPSDKAMLQTADKVMHSINSMFGEAGNMTDLHMTRINPELLTNFRMDQSMDAALAARRASLMPDRHLLSRPSAAEALAAMLENRRSGLIPPGSSLSFNQASTSDSASVSTDPDDDFQQQLQLCCQAAEQELNLASSCLDLIAGFTAAAADVAKRWKRLKAAIIFAGEGTNSSTDASNSAGTVMARQAPEGQAFDRLSDTGLRNLVVGMVFLISRNERQPEVAGAASSLLLIIGKDAQERMDVLQLHSCAPGGRQAFLRLPELLMHGSHDTMVSAAEVYAALAGNTWFASMAGPVGAALALVRMLSANTVLLRTSAALALKALCSSSAEATKAVLLANAVPVVVQLLWSRSAKDFTSGCLLLQVLLARMPRVEQQALLQELLCTGALLRLLVVMSQGTWAGDEWQSPVSIIDFLLNGASSETIKTFGSCAAPVLNDLINTGDIFLVGIAARIAQGITKHEPDVLIQGGFDITGLVKVLLEDDSPELVKQLVVFTLAKMAVRSGDVQLDAGTRSLVVDGLLKIFTMQSSQKWTPQVHQVLRASGDALVHIAAPEDLELSVPKQLVTTGALIGIAWLVVHQEPHAEYKALVASALQIILEEKGGALKSTVERCLTLEQVTSLVKEDHDMQLRTLSTELLARYGTLALADSSLAMPYCNALVQGGGVRRLVGLVHDATVNGHTNRKMRTVAASAMSVLAEVVAKGGPSAELAMAEEGAVPATIALMRQALTWASWLESICKPGLDLLSAMAASGVSDFNRNLDTDEAADCLVKLLNCTVTPVKSQAIKLLPSAVANSETVRTKLTSSEHEITVIMSGLKQDASRAVNVATARVLELLATHYFYSLTEEWPIHALARMAKDTGPQADNQQAFATLGALADSLQRGGAVTAEQLRSFALACAKTGVIPMAVHWLRQEGSMAFHQSIVHFLHGISGRHGVPAEVYKAGAVEPLSIMLVSTGLWAAVEVEILTMISRMASAKAIKPDSLDSGALVASLCGALHPNERSPAIVDQAVHILLLLSEQGPMWISILLAEPKLMSLVYNIANMAPADPVSAKYDSNAQADAFKILRRLGNFPSNEQGSAHPATPGQRFLQQEPPAAKLRQSDSYGSSLKSASINSMKEPQHARSASNGAVSTRDGSVYSSGSKGAMKKMTRMFGRKNSNESS